MSNLQNHALIFLEKIINILEKKQTAREKHSGIGYGGL